MKSHFLQLQVLQDVCKENESIQTQCSKDNPSHDYLIDLSLDKYYMRMHHLKDFAIPLADCTVCSKSTTYSDVEHAHRHLMDFHFRGKTRHETRLRHWIMSTVEQKSRKRNREVINVMETLTLRTRKLLVTSAEIRSGVANRDNEKPDYFLLPSALVKAAEKIFKFMYTAHCVVRFAFNQGRPDTSQLLISPNESYDNLVLADHYGIAASDILSKARNDLVLMAHTAPSDDIAVAMHLHLTLPTTVGMGLFLLAIRDVQPERGLLELYRTHLSSLVSHCPP